MSEIIFTKLFTFTGTVYVLNDKLTLSEILDILIFFSGELIIKYYIKEDELFSLDKNKKISKHLNNYIFALAYQSFLSSLFTDNYSSLAKNISAVSVSYVVSNFIK